MWYEIIPTAVIIMAGVGIPQHAMQYIHNLVFNNPMHRAVLTPMQQRFYLRDERLTSNPWAAGDEGLKNIPDD